MVQFFQQSSSLYVILMCVLYALIIMVSVYLVSGGRVASPQLSSKENQRIQRNITLPAKRLQNNVVSFGLYGNDPRYTTGALHNAELVKYILPGWKCRFYIDDSVPNDVVNALIEEGSEIIRVDNIKGGVAGMFWRFLVADDTTVDRYIVRDADSRLSMREKLAIDEWIASSKSFHIIRDHPNHGYLMNGGLWGGTKNALKVNMTELVIKQSSKDSYLADMQFLWDQVYPQIEDDHIAHDAYHCERFKHSISFPSRRINLEIVGGVYGPDDVPREGDRRLLTTAPEECRRKKHWTYG
ncbi:hypothetical protein MP228_011466 [Amoeboaphelidium protococcarum]|nr:hypothetical protein MP228_011466 [Amoeboaphelidium protococcarum]